MQLTEAVAAFVEHCASIRKLSAHTVRAYELDLRRFTQFVGRHAAVAACDRHGVQRYIRHLFEDHALKETSVQRHLATLRSLFRWLQEERGRDEDPFRGPRIRIRMPRRLPRVIPRSDLRLLLVPALAPVDHKLTELTGYVATEILFATGMRVGELASLLDRAVDVEDGTITITGKGNRQRRVFVPDEIKTLIREYRVARDRHGADADTFLVNARGSAASTDTIRRLIRIRAERCALMTGRVTPHMFRHSVATYLLEEGVDIRHVQRLLGHRSISTTELYTSVADASLKLRITERHPRRAIVE